MIRELFFIFLTERRASAGAGFIGDPVMGSNYGVKSLSLTFGRPAFGTHGTQRRSFLKETISIVKNKDLTPDAPDADGQMDLTPDGQMQMNRCR